MRNKLTIIPLVIIALSTSVLVFGKIRDKNKHAINKNTPTRRTHSGSSPVQQVSSVPEHVIYGFLFSRTAAFQQKAANLSNSSVGSQIVRTSTDNEANLDNRQVLVLAQIALECIEQLRQQDERAGHVIAAFRARFPDRKIPPGVSLPPPPPELKLFQAERNAIILRARDRLREALGEQVFKRFDEVWRSQTVVKTQSPTSLRSL